VRLLPLPEIRRAVSYPDLIGVMREALAAQGRGECDTPMPMHLAPANAEVHIKSSYRRGGRYFALKIAGTFPGNAALGLSTSTGMMLLSSAETGEPVAFLADSGYLTDVRTAAVAAMIARELCRRDAVLGILGTGVQARLQAVLHAEVLPLRRICLWGRTPDRAEQCAREIRESLPDRDVTVASSPAEVAREARLIVTATASRAPLLGAADVRPGTHISAVGADSPGKQELDPAILRRAALILADSRRQCGALGELQHAPDQIERAIEFTGAPLQSAPDSISVADFTGLGVEDLYIAEYVYTRCACPPAPM
jgi:ornithine cyclodeaminase